MSEHAAEDRDIRAALQHAVAQICTEEETSDASAHMSSQAVAALSELVYQYATQCLSNDLLAFSRHANRRTVTLEDVLLVARKDPQGLQAKLMAFAEREKISSSRKEKSTSTPRACTKNTTNTAENTPMTQRMRALQERLKKGIDSSDDSESDAEMTEKPQAGKSASSAYNIDDSGEDVANELGVGKENKQKGHAATKGKMLDDPFASSDEDIDVAAKQVLKKAVVAEFSTPGGTKTGLSSDESENLFE